MKYLIRLAQRHESFRQPEIEALAQLAGVDVKIIEYSALSPFCIVEFETRSSPRSIDEVARSFISRSILSKGIYELWAVGENYGEVHSEVQKSTRHLWGKYAHVSFKFVVDAFHGKRGATEQRQIIDSFSYLDLKGKIDMRNAEEEFRIFEEYDGDIPTPHAAPGRSTDNHETRVSPGPRQPKRIFFSRFIGPSWRNVMDKHDLKKRPYISTTSMDAELALLTANIALAGQGKVFLDPFVGTGSFMVAAAECGAWTLGADIDGRSFRGSGEGLERGVARNFARYGLNDLFGDCLTSDITHTPFRTVQSKAGTDVGPSRRWLDGLIADPPYGVREGLKVLGVRKTRDVKSFALLRGQSGGDDQGDFAEDDLVLQPHLIDGVPAHTLPGYIAPKKPYSFLRMLDDILNFAAKTLVDGGRLAFWMPSANEANQELSLPRHPMLELKHVCVQSFNKWSRRLLVYERKRGEMNASDAASIRTQHAAGRTADELNDFRRQYFVGFQSS